MRKIPEKEARELIVTIGQARSYIQTNLESEIQASLFRLEHVENQLLRILGDPSRTRVCYHSCPDHPLVKP